MRIKNTKFIRQESWSIEAGREKTAWWVKYGDIDICIECGRAYKHTKANICDYCLMKILT